MNRPYDLSLDFSNVDNFYYRSEKTKYRIYPRPGKTTYIEVPIKAYGEIDGFVIGSFAEIRRVQVIVRGMTSAFEEVARLDREGYFYMDGVPAGYLEVILKDSSGSILNTKAIEMPYEGGYVGDIRFDLKQIIEGE